MAKELIQHGLEALAFLWTHVSIMFISETQIFTNSSLRYCLLTELVYQEWMKWEILVWLWIKIWYSDSTLTTVWRKHECPLNYFSTHTLFDQRHKKDATYVFAVVSIFRYKDHDWIKNSCTLESNNSETIKAEIYTSYRNVLVD